MLLQLDPGLRAIVTSFLPDASLGRLARTCKLVRDEVSDALGKKKEHYYLPYTVAVDLADAFVRYNSKKRWTATKGVQCIMFGSNDERNVYYIINIDVPKRLIHFTWRMCPGEAHIEIEVGDDTSSGLLRIRYNSNTTTVNYTDGVVSALRENAVPI